MRKGPQFLLRSLVFALMPVAANAAGTYYTGGYQSPQTARYGNGGYSQYSTYSRTTTGYAAPSAQNQNARTQPQAQSRQTTSAVAAQGGKGGFYLDAGISREYAMWRFEMDKSGSILSWDNLAWNALNIDAGYIFDLGNTKLQVGAGFKYGFQGGDSTMVDDDITKGGFWIADIDVCSSRDNDGNCLATTREYEVGHALSIGSTKDSSLMDFYIGVGLTDIFSWGNVKFTPSIGYRYLKYKLNTKSNYGVRVDTSACFEENGEIQCDPMVVFDDGAGGGSIIWRDDADQMPWVPKNSIYYSTEGTFYFEQTGTSHAYEAEWSGPYIAMDAEYQINKNNAVTGRLELGFPGYTATGDQPYRPDWAHPKSVEDKANMFSALHLGMGANWMTALSDTIMLSLGVTYDYYTVSGADATTYQNGAYYNTIRNNAQNIYDSTDYVNDDGTTTPIPDWDKAAALEIIEMVNELEADCPGWVCKLGSEVDSFYRSLGVRVGINAKF